MLYHNGKCYRVCAVIAAGGSSRRMGFDKLMAMLSGERVLLRSVKAFERCEAVDELVVAAKADMADELRRMLDRAGITKLKAVAQGGGSRQESVYNGVSASSADIDIVCIHDGARPLVSDEVITEALKSAAEHGAATAAVPVKDTIKRGAGGLISETLPREQLYQIQTPQVFLKEQYLEAYRTAQADYSDDCQLFEAKGMPVALSRGDYRNIKLTTAEDIAVAEALMKYTEGEV